MRINFPAPSSGYSASLMGRILDQIRLTLLRVVAYDEAVPYLNLASPDGKVWQITVSNAGTISATQVGVS